MIPLVGRCSPPRPRSQCPQCSYPRPSPSVGVGALLSPSTSVRALLSPHRHDRRSTQREESAPSSAPVIVVKEALPVGERPRLALSVVVAEDALPNNESQCLPSPVVIAKDPVPVCERPRLVLPVVVTGDALPRRGRRYPSRRWSAPSRPLLVAAGFGVVVILAYARRGRDVTPRG